MRLRESALCDALVTERDGFVTLGRRIGAEKAELNAPRIHRKSLI